MLDRDKVIQASYKQARDLHKFVRGLVLAFKSGAGGGLLAV